MDFTSIFMEIKGLKQLLQQYILRNAVSRRGPEMWRSHIGTHHFGIIQSQHFQSWLIFAFSRKAVGWR